MICILLRAKLLFSLINTTFQNNKQLKSYIELKFHQSEINETVMID